MLGIDALVGGEPDAARVAVAGPGDGAACDIDAAGLGVCADRLAFAAVQACTLEAAALVAPVEDAAREIDVKAARIAPRGRDKAGLT